MENILDSKEEEVKSAPLQSEVEQEIAKYQSAPTTTLASEANQQQNSKRTIAAYFYLYKKLEEAAKSSKTDWAKLFEDSSIQSYFTIAESSQDDEFGFNSAVLLLKSWLVAKAGNESLAQTLFNNAKEAENKSQSPYSKGWVHYISAMSSPDANDFDTATSKGFDFNLLIQMTDYYKKFNELIEKGIQTSNKTRKSSKPAKPVATTVTISFLLESYNPFAPVEFENVNSNAQKYFQGMLQLASNNIEDGITLVHQATANGYEGHSNAAKNFWSSSFSRNWVMMRNQLLDVLLTYNRGDPKKTERMVLRNQMIQALQTIDAVDTNDEQKIQAVKREILPLGVKLAGTGMSTAQQTAISFAKPKNGLSQLSLDILEILFKNGEFEEKDIDLADIGKKDKKTDYYPDTAKKGAIQWLKKVSKEQAKQYKEQKLYPQISPNLPKQNPQQITARHPLSNILNLITAKNGDAHTFKVDEMLKDIDNYVQQGFCFQQFLLNLQSQGKCKNIFAEFARSGNVPEGSSLVLFSLLGLTDNNSLGKDLSSISSLCGRYWLAVILLSKNQVEASLRLLAEVHLKLNSASQQGNVLIDFDKIDQGEIMSKLFKDLSWQQMLQTIKTKTDSYLTTHFNAEFETTNEPDEEVKTTKNETEKVQKRVVIQKLRAKVAKDIKGEVEKLPQDTLDKKIGTGEIAQAKKTLLFKVIELMSVGYTSLAQKQGLSSPVNAVAFKNIPQLAKDVLDQLVTQLGLTVDEFKSCMSEINNGNHQFTVINDDHVSKQIGSFSAKFVVNTDDFEVDTADYDTDEEDTVVNKTSRKYTSLNSSEKERVDGAIKVCERYIIAQQEQLQKNSALMKLATPTRMERQLSQENVLKLAKGISSLSLAPTLPVEETKEEVTPTFTANQ